MVARPLQWTATRRLAQPVGGEGGRYLPQRHGGSRQGLWSGVSTRQEGLGFTRCGVPRAMPPPSGGPEGLEHLRLIRGGLLGVVLFVVTGNGLSLRGGEAVGAL